VNIVVALTASQQGQLIDQDFGAILFFSIGSVVPRAGPDLAFYEGSRSLLHIVEDNLGGPVEGDEAMPFGLILPIALAILLMVGSR
jgi:hypothetical protein